MSSRAYLAYAASGAAFLTMAGLVTTARLVFGGKRMRTLERLHGLKIQDVREDEDDILKRPFLDRTAGAMLRSIVAAIGQATPSRVLGAIEERLQRSGNPRNLKANDFLTSTSVLGPATLAGTWILLRLLKVPVARASLLAFLCAFMAVYIPWFRLGMAATRRQRDIRRSLPDIMDLLIVSVEAGLAFDMALIRVVDKFKGTVSEEFQRVLKEMQLGKARKDALKDMATRVDVPELAAMVNAVIQAEQLGVGISGVLKLQSDLIREKRQQIIEEQAMKAPVKMLFPMVFFIFPSIFVVILGPAILNILKIMTGVAGSTP